MSLNPILRQLGFNAKDRVVILHADDLGMCPATLHAFTRLVEFGLVRSGSVMVPCPSFSDLAAYCRQYPSTHRLDMGVHLTLTSEHTGLRWSPVSDPDPASGLLDAAGWFHRSEEVVQGCADPAAIAAIEVELTAQIRLALEAGIDVTHLDLHMGCLMTPALLPVYLQLARETRLPALVWRPLDWPLWGFDEAAAAQAKQRILDYQAEGWPVFDHVAELPLDKPQNRRAQVRQFCHSLVPGLTLLYIHPATDTPELRMITPDWPSRVADYHVFTDPVTRDILHQSEIQLLSYRQLQAPRS